MGSRLKLFTLRSFYDCWPDPEAQGLFLRTVTLKLKGYLHEYAHGTLPVDTTDYIGVHHVVCERRGQDYVPVMAYKSVSLEACRRHNLTFPALNIVGAVGDPATREDTRQAVKAIVERCASDGTHLTYDSSWTIDPEIRKDREMVRRLREILLTAHLFHIGERSPSLSMTCGIYRFKTEQFFGGWGYRPLDLPDGRLPDFSHAYLKGEKAVMIIADRFSEEARKTARENESVWLDRVDVGSVAVRRAA